MSLEEIFRTRPVISYLSLGTGFLEMSHIEFDRPWALIEDAREQCEAMLDTKLFDWQWDWIQHYAKGEMLVQDKTKRHTHFKWVPRPINLDEIDFNEAAFDIETYGLDQRMPELDERYVLRKGDARKLPQRKPRE